MKTVYNVVFGGCVWIAAAMAVLCLVFWKLGHRELSDWAGDSTFGLLVSLMAAGWVGDKLGHFKN